MVELLFLLGAHDGDEHLRVLQVGGNLGARDRDALHARVFEVEQDGVGRGLADYLGHACDTVRFHYDSSGPFFVLVRPLTRIRVLRSLTTAIVRPVTAAPTYIATKPQSPSRAAPITAANKLTIVINADTTMPRHAKLLCGTVTSLRHAGQLTEFASARAIPQCGHVCGTAIPTIVGRAARRQPAGNSSIVGRA